MPLRFLKFASDMPSILSDIIDYVDIQQANYTIPEHIGAYGALDPNRMRISTLKFLQSEYDVIDCVMLLIPDSRDYEFVREFLRWAVISDRTDRFEYLKDPAYLTERKSSSMR